MQFIVGMYCGALSDEARTTSTREHRLLPTANSLLQRWISDQHSQGQHTEQLLVTNIKGLAEVIS